MAAESNDNTYSLPAYITLTPAISGPCTSALFTKVGSTYCTYQEGTTYSLA